MLIGDILYRFRGDYSNLDKGASKSASILGKTGDSSDDLRGRFQDLSDTTREMGGVFQSVFASVIAGGLAIFMKSMALTAARTQVLGTTLMVVGENAGFFREELSASENGLKKLGITTQVARQTLVRMIQTQMDVTRAEELANAARNLAIVSGKNTSQTLETLVHGLVTMQTETLRTAGVTINLEECLRTWAVENGKTAGSLTMLEKRQIMLDEVIKQAIALDGAYTSAMGDVGKQISSFARYTEEAANAFGEFYLPALYQVVVGLGSLLKSYQRLEPDTRRSISTLAVFVTGIGILGASIIAVLTLGPLVVTMFATVAAAFSPVMVVITAVGVAMIAFAALWSTNLWGVRDVTTKAWAIIKALFVAGWETIENSVQGIIALLSLLRKAITRPWEIKKHFAEYQAAVGGMVKETVDAYGSLGEKVSGAYSKIGEAGEKSSVALKEATLKATDEQKKAITDLRNYVLALTTDQVTELTKLHGKELAAYVKKEKEKFDIKKTLTKEALAVEARYVKGLFDLHAKELKQKVDLEKAKIEVMKESGKISEKTAIELSYKLTQRLLKEEIALREENLKKTLVILKKQSKPAEDIELARLKGTQEIESIKLELVKARLKQEAALYKLSASEQEDLDERLLDSLKHRHQMEELEDQRAVDAFLMSNSEMLEKKSQRDLEAKDVYILSVKARLDSLKEAGKVEGEEYKSLNEEYVAVLNEREESYRDHQNRLLSTTVQEEEKRQDILTKLRNERQLFRFKSEVALQAFALHQGTQQEILEMEKRVKANQVSYEEFYTWKRAKEQQTADDLQEILMEAQKGSDEYIQYRVEKMTEAGATEKEITAEVFALKKEYATSFVEGWKLGLEEMVADSYNWADVSVAVVQGFAQNAASALDETLFDFFKTGTFDLMGMFENLGNAMLRVVTQALSQMAIQWLVNTAAGTAYSTATTAGLIAEQAQVTALIIQYKALAAAKMIAGVAGGVPGMQHGAVIPGYGGGDRIHIAVEAGERVVSKEPARKYFPVLEAIQAGTFPLLKGYQEGGVVETPIVSERGGAEAVAPAISILNITDPNEVLRVLTSVPGEQAVLNIIGRRGRTVRRSLR